MGNIWVNVKVGFVGFIYGWEMFQNICIEIVKKFNFNFFKDRGKIYRIMERVKFSYMF